jgi:DNA-directed RNA polymerase specialized sigma24 family protein
MPSIATLYRQATADSATDPRTIAAAVRRLTPDQRTALELRAEGATYRDIGRITHRTHGSARDLVTRALMAMHKRIAQLPRYHRTGRGNADG